MRTSRGKEASVAAPGGVATGRSNAEPHGGDAPLPWGSGASFDSNGVRIHYWAGEGEGEPVLLIHGFMADALSSWVASGVVGALQSGGLRPVAYDMRGHGRSGKPHDPNRYGREMVDDAVRVLDHLEVKRAHVVGYSMGAVIANRLRVEYPERVITATLGGAGWRPERDARSNAEVADGLERGSLGPLIELQMGPDDPRLPDALIEQLSRSSLAGHDLAALAAVWRAPTRPISEASLRDNRVPTLCLIGSLDPLRADVDRMAEIMSDLRVEILEGADHASAFAHPRFAECLLDFLAAR